MKYCVVIATGVAILSFLLAGKICLASVDFLSAPMFSGLSAEERRLLAEYREHYVVLKEHYENAFIIAKEELRSYVTFTGGRHVFRQEGDGPARTIVRDYVYRGNGGKYHRLDEQEIVQDRRQNEESKPSILLGLIADDKSFLFSKSDPRAQYYSLNARQKTSDPNIATSIYSCIFPFLAFSETVHPLEYLLFQKPHYASSCNVLSVAGEPSAQGEVITVLMVAENKEGEKVYYRFEFLRDHHWVIKSSIVETGETRVITRNEYVLVDGHIPELKRSTIEGVAAEVDFFGVNTDSPKEFKLNYFRTFDIVESKFGPVDLSEFDVAQFLPPGVRIGEVTPAGLSTARIVAIVIGVLLVIFGIYMKIRIALRERRNKKP